LPARARRRLDRRYDARRRYEIDDAVLALLQPTLHDERRVTTAAKAKRSAVGAAHRRLRRQLASVEAVLQRHLHRRSAVGSTFSSVAGGRAIGLAGSRCRRHGSRS
jgi:hypothetical protein